MSDSMKHTNLLLSTLSHLIGLKRDADGKLHTDEGAYHLSRAQCLSIENVNVQCAQQWEAGALLNTVAELSAIPESKANQIRKSLKLSAESANGSKPSIAPSVKKGNLPEPAELFSRPGTGPSGFMPPRRVNNTSNAASVSNLPTEANQGRQFSFRSKQVEEMKQPPSSHQSTGGLAPMFSLCGLNPRQAAISGSRFPVPSKTLVCNNVTPQKPSMNLPANTVVASTSNFRTAHDQLLINDKLRGIQRNLPQSGTGSIHVSGIRRPVKADVDKITKAHSNSDESEKTVSDNPEVNELMCHESMKNIDPKMVEAILNEVVQVASTNWEDIAGLDEVKSIIREIIIWPMLRPDIFTGLRASPRGIMFFGPPGTGKTMFGRLIATQSKSTFFNISASSLTSKWIGDGEKMVRALFQVARLKQPAVIFIDEIDSILTQRSDSEHESSRRLKTEFLIQFDGCATQSEDRILVIGVTNRPQELDEAARRRLVKRVYIPLPDQKGREQLVRNLLHEYSSELTEEDYNSIAEMTEGYSGADMTSLCREAAYGPIREVGHMLQSLDASHVRPMQMKDFVAAQRQVKSSVSQSDVVLYKQWDEKFGCHL